MTFAQVILFGCRSGGQVHETAYCLDAINVHHKVDMIAGRTESVDRDTVPMHAFS